MLKSVQKVAVTFDSSNQLLLLLAHYYFFHSVAFYCTVCALLTEYN